MPKPILQNGDPVLREQAKPLPAELFGTPELSQMVKDMAEALDAENDGVAIAGPQIGLPYRVFVVRYDRTLPIQEPINGKPAPEPPADIGVFINPQFVKTSRRRSEMDEGCLSVKGIFGTTLRYDRATIRAYDQNGKAFERGGGGLLAQIFQHETDHLEGILFIDHAHDLVDRREESPTQVETDEPEPDVL